MRKRFIKALIVLVFALLFLSIWPKTLTHAQSCDSKGATCCIPSGHGEPYCNGNFFCDLNSNTCQPFSIPKPGAALIPCTNSDQCRQDLLDDSVFDTYSNCFTGAGGAFCSQPAPPPAAAQAPQELFCDSSGNPTKDTTSGRLYTAIGCIPITESSAFLGFILRWAIGIGAGLAFLLIIIAAFQIMTSTGNPDRLKAGQELLTSAIMGLILLIFSVFILQLVGVTILKIPFLG